jgi:hypothetical protein
VRATSAPGERSVFRAIAAISYPVSPGNPDVNQGHVRWVREQGGETRVAVCAASANIVAVERKQAAKTARIGNILDEEHRYGFGDRPAIAWSCRREAVHIGKLDFEPAALARPGLWAQTSPPCIYQSIRTRLSPTPRPCRNDRATSRAA